MFGSRHNISELSSAFSAGNSGATFEHNIQAVSLLTLLVDGFSPILEAPIDRIELQAKHLGYAIDDFVVVAANGAKLLCQVKHTLAISYGDKQFEKVMNAAWHDFNSESYRPSFDKIALITGPIAKNSSHDLHCIYEQAWRLRLQRRSERG